MSRDRLWRPVQPSSPCREVGFITSIMKSHCRFLRKVYLLEGNHSCFNVENGLQRSKRIISETIKMVLPEAVAKMLAVDMEKS